MIPEMKVDPFGFTLNVPLQKFYNYVDDTKNTGRGIMPDCPINNGIQEILKGDHSEMKMVVELIQKGVRN